MKTIREFRRERGWTQFELALAVGVQPQTIYLWESGRRLPQVPQVRKLGQVFGLCSDEIDLEPLVNRRRSSPHQTPAGRRPGEPIPGRDLAKRALVHGAEEMGQQAGHAAEDLYPDPSSITTGEGRVDADSMPGPAPLRPARGAQDRE